jgi:hypothetical protein
MHNTAAIVTAIEWIPDRAEPFLKVFDLAVLRQREPLIGLELACFAVSPSQSIHP